MTTTKNSVRKYYGRYTISETTFDFALLTSVLNIYPCDSIYDNNPGFSVIRVIKITY